MKYYDAWQGEDGIRNVVPRRYGKLYPELPQFSPIEVLAELLPDDRTVIEVGCGFGRLCVGFYPEHYIGIDINSAAIEKARATYQDYIFEEMSNMGAVELHFPESAAKFAYTVMLHVPDEEFPQFVRRLCESTSDQIVIAERMDSNLRHPLKTKETGILQPAFGRDQDEFESEFAKWYFRLRKVRQYPYFKGGLITFLSFEKE